MKESPPTTKYILKAKIWLILVFFLIFSLTPLPGQQKAQAWETWISNPIQSFLEVALDQIKIMITGALKQAAIKMIHNNVSMSISGGSGSGETKFIVNWQSALVDDPKEKAALYIEQLSTNSLQMKGSSFYVSASSLQIGNQFEGVGEKGLVQYFQSPRFIDSVSAQESSGSSENYYSLLSEIVSSVTEESSCAVSEVTPSSLEASESFFKDLEKFTDPYTYKTCLQEAYEKKLGELKEEAQTKAIAYQGFSGTEEDGNTIYPGSLVKEMMANVENMGNQALTNARGVGEVITSMVMQMVTKAMNNGIGNVKSQIQRNSNNVSEKAQSQVQNQTQNYGPGALYGDTGASSSNSSSP